jgi:ssDNA-binding Zn-finger/Zn-ribbon topoisomerase 1
MTWTLLVLFALIIIIVIAVKYSPKTTECTAEFQYQKLEVLFTPAERSFLGVLKMAANDDIEVFGKVRVADVITPRKGQDRSKWQTAFNKISAKHFDFLLCNKNDLTPICAIELNDSSHNSKKTKNRDAFLEGACQSAGLPLVQIKAKATYKVIEIKEAISSYIPNSESVQAQESAINIKPKNINADKTCPKCSSAMTVRVAKKGKNIGNEFWACSAFPKCRHIEAKKA